MHSTNCTMLSAQIKFALARSYTTNTNTANAFSTRNKGLCNFYITAKMQTHTLSVFPSSAQGGNPTSIFIDADSLTTAEMQSLAKKLTHECGFVLASQDSDHDFRMRYFVPKHEMEMCGHATVGAVWLLNQLGKLHLDNVLISTLSGDVEAQVRHDKSVHVSQPDGIATPLPEEQKAGVLECLGLSDADVAGVVRNGRTSRAKTLVPVAARDVLARIAPTVQNVGSICEVVGSTGLYPYAVIDRKERIVEARQFPKGSGYAEDPATGIAAAALVSALWADGWTGQVRVRQGWAMGKPSEIVVSPRENGGCWISGNVRREEVK